jgi:murein DD-endopeptidase MepM/ murein hydrolase activator NlpD
MCHDPASGSITVEKALGSVGHRRKAVQVILISRRMKTAKAYTIMPRHLLAAAAAFIALVVAASGTLAWALGTGARPAATDLAAEAGERHVANNLQLLASHVGELRARLLHLDALGDRLAGLAGIGREAPVAARPSGQGGALVPLAPSTEELQRELDRLAAEIEVRSDELKAFETGLLERRVRDRLVPTALPVREAELGSPFGVRTDPIAGLRAQHEGIDFNAPSGTPVLAAADGVVQAASWQGDFGNMVEVDHGEGLMTRYAHLQRMQVRPGMLVKRGDTIGTVGSTGRSTGAHLHFEVRVFGVPQNPARFLKQDDAYAQLKRR